MLRVLCQQVKVKVYAGKYQRAFRNGSQLVLTLARAQIKIKTVSSSTQLVKLI